MEDVKTRMYNYETTPPVGVWDAIAQQLDGNEAKVIPLNRSNRRFYYIAAASVAVILLCVLFFTHHTSQSGNNGFFSFSSDKQDNNGSSSNAITDTAASAKNDNVIITVPQEETNVQNDSDEEITAKNTLPVKGGPHEKIKNDEVKYTDSADKTPDDKTSSNKIIASNTTSTYITIEGPQGQPIKVSTKMATLIDSSDNKVPPKPSWNKKINEWREIMKGNTLAPTPGNFLDIIELTKTLKDNKKP
jgi:hypothetical protein